jgi:long-chain acyl-CoA synthetase
LDPDDHSSCFFEDFIQRSINNEEEIKAEVANRMSRVNVDDTVHLIYTSGTTGEPKGVMLTHANYQETWRIHGIRFDYLAKPFVSICMLPLTHIFEKAWSFLCLYWGCTLAINLDPREIQDTIREVRPNAMCCVPRFWEKVYAGVQEKLAESKPFMRKIMTDGIETGRIHNLEYRNKGKKAPWWIRVKFNFYNKTVFQLLKKTVGIENGTIFPCAGAALSDQINIFMQSVNIPLFYGYGLTETTATVCCFPNVGFSIGTVGKVMPGVEVKIGADNEILVKGRTIMQGYYKKPDATARDLDADGWFRTGDSGYLTENNEIVLTERIKDLYKTANGKYVAPQQIEIRLTEDKFIETAAVIGDRRKYVTALLIPDYEALKLYAAENNILYDNLTELCNHASIIHMIEERIDKLQQIFANYEQIKRFTLLPHPFSMETGELTNTLKLKRSFIAEKYSQEIDAMY